MSRPNLLFIFTDEQRADTMAAYGNDAIQMPCLNKLASQSTVFDRCYVTQPVCTPSRSSIMTGLYPHTSGCTENNVALRQDAPCISEMLPDDYTCGYHGKWHLGDEIFQQRGFSEWISIEDMYIPHYSEGRDRSERSSYHHWLVSKGCSPAGGGGDAFNRAETARYTEDLSRPAFLAEEATRFIRENRDGPFCLFVNFLEPHMPFFGPRDDQHDPAAVALPGNFDSPPGPDQHLKARLFERGYVDEGHSGLPLVTEADWRRMIANYWGLCSLVDTHVGRILATLSECGLDDNTIVVYTSDHGDMMGSHRLIAKCVMFEEAVRVPLLVRMPGAGRGGGGGRASRVMGPVGQVDLVPTLLDLMDVPAPDHLQGTSLAPQITGELDHSERDVFIEWNGPNNGFDDRLGSVNLTKSMTDVATKEEAYAATTDPVRTVITADGWKLNRSAIGQHELYNLDDDPFETKNLASSPEHASVMGDLSGRIARWQEETGDEIELSEVS